MSLKCNLRDVEWPKYILYIALCAKHIPILHTLELQVPKDCNFIININGSQKYSTTQTIQVNIQGEAIASNLTIIGQN